MNFEKPEIKIVKLEAADIITASHIEDMTPFG